MLVLIVRQQVTAVWRMPEEAGSRRGAWPAGFLPDVHLRDDRGCGREAAPQVTPSPMFPQQETTEDAAEWPQPSF